MSTQEYPFPKLYAWNGRLIQKVLKFKGQDCQFAPCFEAEGIPEAARVM